MPALHRKLHQAISWIGAALVLAGFVVSGLARSQGPASGYDGWAGAVAEDVNPAASGRGQGSQSAARSGGYGPTGSVPLPAVTKWSRSPPNIPPQAAYPQGAYSAPRPYGGYPAAGMYPRSGSYPLPGTGNPRLAQAPPGYPSSARPGPTPPLLIPQPEPIAPPGGNAFAAPPLPQQGGFAAPQQQAGFAAPPAALAPMPEFVPAQVPSQPEAIANRELPRNEQILAYVGPDVILMGDVLPEVEHALKEALKGKGTPPDSEMEKIRTAWIRGRLKGVIELRQILVHVRQKIPDDKYLDIRKQMGDAFDKKRVKQLLEDFKDKGVVDRSDLEKRSLELFGVSFRRVRESFIDQTIGASFLSQALPNKDEEISHADALGYYKEHESEYEVPAKARWEQITLKYGPGKHTRDEAWRIIAQCGNAIIGGAKFDAMARQHSEDAISAKNGGAQDWIGQGSLVQEKLDAALFDPKLPVGTLSPIIEDGDAFHIIRVVERRSAGKTSFADAQKEIKEKLKKERQDAKRREFIDKIKQQVPVRNVFEEENPAPPPRSRGESDE